MARGRLSEGYVQTEALMFLKRYYLSRSDVISVVAEKELVLQSGGRADGLVAMKLSNRNYATASLEAKSFKTRHDLMPRNNYRKWLKHGFLVAAVFLLISGYWGRQNEGWLWNWLFPLLLSGSVFFIFLLTTRNHRRYKSFRVIQQLGRYPANERWVAVSTDVFNDLPAKEAALFKWMLRKNGMGLLLVSPRRKVRVEQKPKFQAAKLGDHSSYLRAYKRGPEMMEQLDSAIRSWMRKMG